MFCMKNTTAMADYELRHIEALRKDLAGCTVLLKRTAASRWKSPAPLPPMAAACAARSVAAPAPVR